MLKKAEWGNRKNLRFRRHLKKMECDSIDCMYVAVCIMVESQQCRKRKRKQQSSSFSPMRKAKHPLYARFNSRSEKSISKHRAKGPSPIAVKYPDAWVERRYTIRHVSFIKPAPSLFEHCAPEIQYPIVYVLTGSSVDTLVGHYNSPLPFACPIQNQGCQCVLEACSHVQGLVRLW